MSSVYLAFSSDEGGALTAPRSRVRALSAMREGDTGIVVEVQPDRTGRADRLLALGVTPGAAVTVLQTLPGIVFLCDQTELAIERGVADAIRVRPADSVGEN